MTFNEKNIREDLPFLKLGILLEHPSSERTNLDGFMMQISEAFDLKINNGKSRKLHKFVGGFSDLQIDLKEIGKYPGQTSFSKSGDYFLDHNQKAKPVEQIVSTQIASSITNVIAIALGITIGTLTGGTGIPLAGATTGITNLCFNLLKPKTEEKKDNGQYQLRYSRWYGPQMWFANPGVITQDMRIGFRSSKSKHMDEDVLYSLKISFSEGKLSRLSFLPGRTWPIYTNNQKIQREIMFNIHWKDQT